MTQNICSFSEPVRRLRDVPRCRGILHQHLEQFANNTPIPQGHPFRKSYTQIGNSFCTFRVRPRGTFCTRGQVLICGVLFMSRQTHRVTVLNCWSGIKFKVLPTSFRSVILVLCDCCPYRCLSWSSFLRSPTPSCVIIYKTVRRSEKLWCMGRVC